MFRILVVDRNVTRANLTARAINDLKFGVKINYALSTTQALIYLVGSKRAGKLLPDLIVLGAEQPDARGKHALKTLSKALRKESVPILVVSDSKDAEEASGFYEAGATAYVQRCGSPSDYIQTLADAIAFNAMVAGLIPKQTKFFPENRELPSIGEVLQVHL